MNVNFLNKGLLVFVLMSPIRKHFWKRVNCKTNIFGCDAKNLTALEKDGVIPPLVVYFANRPYEYYSNVSTFDLTFTDEQKRVLSRMDLMLPPD